MKRAQRIVRRRQLTLALVLTATIIGSFIAFSSLSSARGSREVYTYYDSYQIQPGDTLWSIADQYMTPETSDKNAFVANIKKTNHMLDNNIKAGDYLVIEYCAYVKQ